jgi:hypothetical protein
MATTKVSKLGVKREVIRNLVEGELERANGAVVTCGSNKYSGCSTFTNIGKGCACNAHQL